MKLAPFGGEQPHYQPSLSDIIGHIQRLIEDECERTDPRKDGGLLDMRIEITDKAAEMLEVAENADAKIMRRTLRELKRGNAPAHRPARKPLTRL